MKKNKGSYRPFFLRLGTIFMYLLPAVFLINLITPVRQFSEMENRVLSGRPSVTASSLASGTFSSQYETYVNDQFVMRDLFVRIKAIVDRLMGKVESNGVYLGKKGYLMEAFTPPDETRLGNLLTAMLAFKTAHPDVAQYAVIAPNAVNILSDCLPTAAPAVDQNPYIDRVYSVLANAGVTGIDLRPALSSHIAESLYYKTDHHWTTRAAYYAYLEAAKAMGLDASLVTYQELPATKTFQGTLSARSGYRSSATDEIDVFLPVGNELSYVVNYVDEQRRVGSFYQTSRLSTRDKYAMFFDGNHAQVRISFPGAPKGTLLVLKDSYANSLVPFLAPHYQTIIMIDPRYYYGDLALLMEEWEVDDVLYLYNANTFFSDTSLELLLSPD